MNKKSLFLILLAVLLLPFAAHAQSITGMASSIATVVVQVATWIVVIMWVVTGILFLIAGGEPGKINTAKTALFSAVAGTILVILAWNGRQIVCNSFGLQGMYGCQ